MTADLLSKNPLLIPLIFKLNTIEHCRAAVKRCFSVKRLLLTSFLSGRNPIKPHLSCLSFCSQCYFYVPRGMLSSSRLDTIPCHHRDQPASRTHLRNTSYLSFHNCFFSSLFQTINSYLRTKNCSQ